MHESTRQTVALVRCPGYGEGVAGNAVRQAVDLLGGIEALVRPGERILIKPNLLKASHPDTAVVTHPEIVRAVIRLVHDAGGTALVGDSPGMGAFRTVVEKSGLMDVVREEGAQLVDLDEGTPVSNDGRFRRFAVARVAREADGIINLPKLKTHGMTVLTGAIKNLFGCVPGKRKVQWHFTTGVNHDQFMRMLVELSALLRPRLTIMDAVVGMEGNGPGSGDPRFVGAVIAGRDVVAVDVIASLVVGVAPDQLPLLRAAAEAGIGETRQERIIVLGEPLERIVVDGFRLPPQEHLEWPIPEWARRALKEALTTRPVIDHDRCTACGICRDHCPQGAIAVNRGRMAIARRSCIRCYCCQEFCPNGAVHMGSGWALRLFGRRY